MVRMMLITLVLLTSTLVSGQSDQSNQSNQCVLTEAEKNIQGNCPVDSSAKTCLNDIHGSTTCTAKDSPIGQVYACINGVCDGSVPRTCVKGEMTQFTLNITIQANANRYDVGAYIAPGQTQAKTGYCCRFILSPVTTNEVLSNSSGGCGPYANLDNDACGDIRANVVTYELITLDLLCQPDNTNNKLAAAFCTSWDNTASANCNSYLDLKPGTGSKCKCSQITIGNVDVLQSALMIAFEPGSSTCATPQSSVVFRYRVTNPNLVQLSSVTVSDSMGSTIQCCADFNSTACPSGYTVGSVIPILSGSTWVICESTGSSITGPIVNTATVAGDDTRYSPSVTQTATSQPFTVQFVSLLISQVVTNAGTWSITITNMGSVSLSNFVFSSTNVNYSPCIVSNTVIGPGASLPCSVSLPPTGTVCQASNTVSVSATAATAGACSSSSTDSDTISFNRVCRPVTGSCDTGENCESGACPADLHAPSGTLCGNPSSGICDLQDTCDGNNNCVNNVSPGSTVCRPATGTCDISENCTGSSPSCPSDIYAPSGTLCGNPSGGVCDLQDTCDSNNNCVDRLSPASTVCRPATGDCDVAESCTGLSPSCPIDLYAVSGTLCGNAPIGTCDLQDTCDSDNNCVDNYGTCSDGYSCTQDTCSPAPPHNCQYVPDDTVCVDAWQCTVDVCVAGDQSLQTTYGLPSATTGCVNYEDVTFCDSCTCAPASACLVSSPDKWSDGCVHHFISLSGSVLPPGDESIANCVNS